MFQHGGGSPRPRINGNRPASVPIAALVRILEPSLRVLDSPTVAIADPKTAHPWLGGRVDNDLTSLTNLQVRSLFGRNLLNLYFVKGLAP